MPARAAVVLYSYLATYYEQRMVVTRAQCTLVLALNHQVPKPLAPMQAEMQQAEARAQEVQQRLSAAEADAAAKSEEVAGLQKQMEGLQANLDKKAAELAEKEAKVQADTNRKPLWCMCLG